MRQHPGMMRFVRRGAAMAAVASCLLFGASQSQAQDEGGQPSPDVARISFVQGEVQLMAGQGGDFQQAVMNMPVVDGSRLQTGGDGQAEIEFGDGSVARLTPNSSLQFDHLGADQVQISQQSGLGYFELNVGDGHPQFNVQFANLNMQATANAIVRVGLDSGWEVAVMAGSVNVQGNGIPPTDVAANQSIRAGDPNNGAPFTVAQGINGDSWDNWNQDRDQAIAQEASEQTPARDDSANPQSENWNDLDADGNWYPVEGSGNVWVPAGVDADWDPYGAGYWAFYPTLGYTWVSAYPWGWLPYHCGAWNYYSFGWGWSPGAACGRAWAPVVIVRSHPPGWIMPPRPVGIHPLPGQRLVAVDRGPAARGPWGFQGSGPRVDHQLTVNLRGQNVAPLARVDVRTLAGVRGTGPGSRAVISGTTARPVSHSTYMWGANPPRAVEQPGRVNTYQGGQGSQVQRPTPPATQAPRPGVGYSGAQPRDYNQRSTYVPREPAPAVHYSPPPQQHYSAPAPQQPHYSAPPPSAPHPSGGGIRR